MPRPATATGADGLPLWDTFEASFFLLAGLCMGIVLGFLLPSLWRTLRRRFRNTKRFGPHSPSLPRKILPSLAVLRDSPPSDGEDNESEVTLASLNVTLVSAFVLARSFVQENNLRDAVRIYLDILGHEQVSRPQTNQALFELSQTYRQMGMQSRSFDTAFELLHRKPKDELVLNHLLETCEIFSLFEKFPEIFHIFSGRYSKKTSLKMSHCLSMLGEQQAALMNTKAALETSRSAVRAEISAARPKILLWAVTSEELWARAGQDPRGLWNAFAIDLEARLQIGMETRISPVAGVEHLSRLFAHLNASADAAEVFPYITPEFERTLQTASQSAEEKLYLDNLVFYSALTLLNTPDFLPDVQFFKIVRILSSRAQHLLEIRLQTPALAVPSDFAFFSHRCKSCEMVFSRFHWKCSACHSMESHIPVSLGITA